MAGNYPPGVSAGTRNAPWNEEPAPECEECGAYYNAEGEHDTIENSDGEEVPCPNEGETLMDYEESAKIHQAEMKMDQQRIEEMEEK